MQDIFHAEQRVIRSMNKQHVDYTIAVTALKAVFGRLLTKKFRSCLDLARELDIWAEKWAEPTESAYMTTIGRVQMAGKSNIYHNR